MTTHSEQHAVSSLADTVREMLPIERDAMSEVVKLVGVKPILGLIGLISLIGSRCGPPA